MSFLRKMKRRQQKIERKAFRDQLVKEGKKLIFNLKTNKLEIVEAKKPYVKNKEESND